MEIKREQSEFNMAVSYLNRLNVLFSLCDEAAISLDSYTWFHTLLALERELSTEMKEKELEEFQKLIETIRPLITKTLERNQKKGITEIHPELYEKLHLMELNLRRILKEAGLQSKMKDDPRKALM